MSSPADQIIWDDDPKNPNIVWDDNGQTDKARDLVHGGQDSFFPNMATGAGKALVELARKGLNLAGPMENRFGTVHDESTSGYDKFTSPEAIRAASADTAAAASKPGGSFGRDVANIAGTSVVGGPAEAAVGKIALPGMLKLLAPILKGSAGGATTAAVTADPEHRGEAAVEGGGIGAVLGGTLGALNRATTGVVKKSPDLQLLEGDVARTNAIPGASQRKLFVPVSQGADPNDAISSTIGGLYRGGLPYIPGVAARLSKQSNEGIDTMMGTMLQSSAPEGHIIPGSAVNDMQLSTAEVKKAYDRIYQNLRKVDNISVPKDFKDELSTKIRAADPQIPKSDVDAHVEMVFNDLQHQAENNTNGKINAFNLKNTRDNVPTLAERLGREVPAEQKAGLFDTTKEYIDDIFGNKLKQSFNLNHKSTQDILTAYKSNAPNFENFQALNAAVNSPAALANSGAFRPGGVAAKANDFTDIQGMDQSFKKVFGKSAVQPSASARVAGYPVVLGATGYLGHLPGLAAVLGGGNALTTKAAQRGLYGDTALQRTIEKLMEKYPRTATATGYGLRTAITSNLGDDDASP